MRIRILTSNRLQRKYLFLILLSMLIPLFVVGGCLYYLIFQIMAEQLGIPESIAINLIPVLNRINFLLLVGLPPVLILLFIWGIIVTHRFTGPLRRLENDLKKISEGDRVLRLKLRKEDDLRAIADLINKALDRR